ncbi:hypothetical protein BCF55_1132 [Hydrogenivirga caldilitoris]|uniref:Uncharacterized protein n=1 Tax=Hydrogenivirga caldilitoris TaxID=246264 RepID=A0A497XPN3_9AQUI|nr:hypothetical protein [Hydrogenivirga caldilitoris]RLJ70848.1 hypothetical protein BCF55_1132 [Hydrogenivirga caldilitoris]
MKLQTAVRSESHIEDVKQFLKKHYPEKYSPIENWQELSIKLHAEPIGEGNYIVLMEVPEEDFAKLTDIFPSEEEALGAFMTTAQEAGWEIVPQSYVVYHAEFEGDLLIAAVKTEEGISKHDQLHLEEMIQKMLRYPRVIVYSSDVLTYIKDLYPEVDSKAYIVSREIARAVGRAPELEDIAKLYGKDVSTLEGKLELIEELLRNPVKLPGGEVNIKPYYYPVEV